MTPKWKPDLLAFDAASHSYTYDSVRVPSATQIMELVGITRKYDGDPWFGERGTAVHLGCHLLDEGTLDWATVDPQIEPFVKCYADWQEASGVKYLHTELAVANPDLWYAGRLDRIGELGGRVVVLDLKTGAKQRATGVQLALYALAFSWDVDGDPFEVFPQRYALHLSANEPAKLIEYADPVDYDAARGAVAVARWRKYAKTRRER